MSRFAKYPLLLLALLVSFISPIIGQSESFQTTNGKLSITPILHSSLVLQWNDLTILSDPYGGAQKYEGFTPDLVLITDIHGDHLNSKTLAGLELAEATLIAPQAVIDKLGDIQFKEVHALANGKSIGWQDIKVEAIPMYNLPETEDSRHPKGRGNGYVLNMGGKRIYISGDTEDITEMRALKDIDIAFVCMNIPYTMEVKQAASAVLEFTPAVVYPFHYRGQGGFSDIELFKSLVNEGDEDIEVRLLDWYPED
ncbi:MAG: MBL fold metallo-hydrolase [Bacteroidia bacterium]